VVDLVLSEREQQALRTLLQAEPVPGSPVLSDEMLDAVDQLIGWDSLEVAVADSTGVALAIRSIPDDRDRRPGSQICDGPLWLGLVHVSRMADAHEIRRFGLADSLWLGVRNGSDAVAQLDLSRRRRTFSERDKAMLRMIAPTLERHLRERPTPHVPDSLTLQERRVLMHVAAGRSNAEIAENLFIAEGTVRKHLEHSFRKLGVTNRVAAVAALQGRDEPGLDLAERIARYA